MCLAIPVKLQKVAGGRGQVGGGKNAREVRLDLIENPQVGDWLLCHGDLAVNKVEEKEALKILEILGECSHGH